MESEGWSLRDGVCEGWRCTCVNGDTIWALSGVDRCVRDGVCEGWSV